MKIFGMDWRARLLLALGAGLLLVGALYVDDPLGRILLSLVGLAVIIAGGLLERHLKSRASRQ